MKVIVSQTRMASANPNLPLMINNGYEVTEHAGEMFTSRPGYEIAAVYITQDPLAPKNTGPCGQCSLPHNNHVAPAGTPALNHAWESW